MPLRRDVEPPPYVAAHIDFAEALFGNVLLVDRMEVGSVLFVAEEAF